MKKFLLEKFRDRPGPYHTLVSAEDGDLRWLCKSEEEIRAYPHYLSVDNLTLSMGCFQCRMTYIRVTDDRPPYSKIL